MPSTWFPIIVKGHLHSGWPDGFALRLKQLLCKGMAAWKLHHQPAFVFDLVSQVMACFRTQAVNVAAPGSVVQA